MQQDKRRYLLDKRVVDLFQGKQTKPKLHTIFFTKIKLCKEIRYEQISGNYIKIKRSGVAYPKTITYQNITEKDFTQMKTRKEGHMIRKKRYRIQLEHSTGIVDFYTKELKGLSILELPLKSGTNHIDPHRDENLNPYIVADITDDPRYEERYLALFGNPSKHPYNIYAIFKDIEQGRRNDPSEIIFDEMKSIDAIRIILFHRYIEISRQIKKLSAKDDPFEPLTKIDRNLNRSILLLESYEEIFDEKRFQPVISHLRKLRKVIAPYFDMIMIQKKIQKCQKRIQNPALSKISKSAAQRASAEIHRIKRYFKSREYAIIKHQYELFLKEKSKTEKRYEAQLPLGYTLKVKFHNLYNRILQQADFLDGCDDRKSYETLHDTLKSFANFTACFDYHPALKQARQSVKKVEKILKHYEKQQKRSKYLQLLKMLDSDSAIHLKPDEKKILQQKMKDILKKEKSFAKKFYRKLQKLKKEPMHL
jgi:CYTH domain-containing protein